MYQRRFHSDNGGEFIITRSQSTCAQRVKSKRRAHRMPNQNTIAEQAIGGHGGQEAGSSASADGDGDQQSSTGGTRLQGYAEDAEDSACRCAEGLTL